jgi:hypothetical protein
MEYKGIVDWRYNSLYKLPCEKDNQQFLLMRWIDNGVVDMVSTVHTGRETIVKRRKKPSRETSTTNYRHITTVFGSDWEKMIAIPGCIDDYNNTVGGVDKAYQLISYYRPRIRCRRTWMPMFMHCLDICRVNSYVIAEAKGVCDSQKDYTLDWIQALNRRAQFMDLQATQRATVDFVSPNKATAKRTRMSSTNPQLPAYQFQGGPEQHVPYVGKEQRACTYCKYLFAIAKKDGDNPLPEVARPSRRCFLCNDHLCSLHFELFHSKEDS